MLNGRRSERCFIDLSFVRIAKDRSELSLEDICNVFRVGLDGAIFIKE